MAMHRPNPRRQPSPLTRSKLEEMALNYVGRFATSRAKLVVYLSRKLRERGWEGEGEAPIDEIADRIVRLGYIDDRAFAVSRARSLTSRGYGQRRVLQALAISGIEEEDGAEARDLAAGEAVNAAMKFAQRKSIGPYASSEPDAAQRERALAAMVRAGHGFALARAIIGLKPGEIPDFESLFNVR